MKHESKSFSDCREVPSPEYPSRSPSVILGLTWFEPEARLLWLAAASGKTRFWCCCALFCNVPDLISFQAVNLNRWFSDTYFFLCKTVYKKRINSWSDGISCSHTPLEEAWSSNVRLSSRYGHSPKPLLRKPDLKPEITRTKHLLLGLKLTVPFSYSLTWEEKSGYHNSANYNKCTK